MSNEKMGVQRNSYWDDSRKVGVLATGIIALLLAIAIVSMAVVSVKKQTTLIELARIAQECER